MRTIRRVLLVVLAAAVPTLGYAAASSNASRALGANGAAIGRCDTDGVTIIQNLSGSNVVSVTVGAIAAACATASISVNVNNGTTNRSGTGTVPAGGGSLTVTLSSSLAAQDDEQVDVAISGP